MAMGVLVLSFFISFKNSFSAVSLLVPLGSAIEYSFIIFVLLYLVTGLISFPTGSFFVDISPS